MPKRHRNAVLTSIALTLGAAALWFSAAMPASARVASIQDPPVPTKELFVVYSINNIGYIDVCGCKRKKVRQGSLTRRGSYIRQARYHHPEMLLLDGGNTLFGPDDRKAKDFQRQQLLEKAKVIVESYNRMGYSAQLVGHHDLNLGLADLRQLEAMADFPFLSANLIDAKSGEQIFPATVEVEIGGVKIGILGITLDTIPEYYLEKANPDSPLALSSSLEAARKHVPGLRKRNDIVVLLSANQVDVNRKIAAELPGIDIIIDPLIELGNHAVWVDEEDLIEKVGDVMLMRTDSQGARLGTLDITWYPDGRPLTVIPLDVAPPEGRSLYWFERVSLEPHFLEDPDIVLLVEAFKKGSGFVDTERLPLLHEKDKFLTAATCSVCHVEQTEFWKTTTHSKAFASLEATGDQWRQDCIACHVVGYGQAFIAPADAEPYKNVQCESCHGLNPQHPLDPVAHPWPRIEETSCLVCHNKAQTFMDFRFLTERRKVACPPMKRN